MLPCKKTFQSKSVKGKESTRRSEEKGKDRQDLRNLADGVPQQFLHGEGVSLGCLAQVPHVCPQLLGLLLQHPQLVVHLRGESKVCKGGGSVRMK